MGAGSCFGSSNEALCSLAAALEVQLAKMGKQSKQGKLGGKFAEPSGVQVKLCFHWQQLWMFNSQSRASKAGRASLETSLQS